MAEKRLPIGICDHCECELPAQDWYTSHGKPRRYCSIDCRNTANSRAGNLVRTAKLRQAVADGRWQNPHHIHPPTGEEQASRARKGRLREVTEGRWRNPALASAARLKLSQPRKHGDDPVLHRALEQLKQGARMVELSAAERERYLAYRRQLRLARLTEVRAYQRARYRHIMDAADSTARERLRALWRRHAKRQRRAVQMRDQNGMEPLS